MIARMHEEPAAPMAAARDGLHALAVDLDMGIAIAVPLPIAGGADRRGDGRAENIGERPAETPEQGERQAVHADVVVFPVLAGLAKCARHALLGARLVAEIAVPVDQVRLVPERALPLRGVVEELAPDDLRIVRRGEAAVVNEFRHGLVDVADEPALDRDPRNEAQIAFHDAEAHVGAGGVAPLGDDHPAVQDEPVRSAARRHGTDDLVPGRRLGKAADDLGFDVARPPRLVRRPVSNSSRHRLGIEPGLAAEGVPPVTAMRRRHIGFVDRHTLV